LNFVVKEKILILTSNLQFVVYTIKMSSQSKLVNAVPTEHNGYHKWNNRD